MLLVFGSSRGSSSWGSWDSSRGCGGNSSSSSSYNSSWGKELRQMAKWLMW
jgi:hypothetical protein